MGAGHPLMAVSLTGEALLSFFYLLGKTRVIRTHKPQPCLPYRSDLVCFTVCLGPLKSTSFSACGPGVGQGCKDYRAASP